MEKVVWGIRRPLGKQLKMMHSLGYHAYATFSRLVTTLTKIYIQQTQLQSQRVLKVGRMQACSRIFRIFQVFFFWTQKAINSPVILGFSVCACMWFVGGINACVCVGVWWARVWVLECRCIGASLNDQFRKGSKNVNALGRISPVLSVQSQLVSGSFLYTFNFSGCK